METIPKEAPQAPDDARIIAEDVDDIEPPLVDESDDEGTPKHAEESDLTRTKTWRS